MNGSADATAFNKGTALIHHTRYSPKDGEPRAFPCRPQR